MPSKAENLSKLAASLLAGGYVAVNTLTITDSSYTAVSDLAVRTTGGYIKITGSNFAAGCVVYVNGSPATSTTFVSSTEVRAQLPALAVGIYSLMLFNAATAAAIWASGIVYSAAPVWTSTSYNNPSNVVNTQLLATGDGTLIYTLASGTLPTGVTLSSTGLLSGTVSGVTSTTTFSFTVAVTDAESQANPQVISLSLTFYIGKLWSWGDNTDGRLGLGDTTARSSPVQIGTLTNWLSLNNGQTFSVAVKKDGTLWTWGKNNSGQLGDGTTVSKSSPIQIGALTNWAEVSAGDGHVAAIKTDGTMWTWGQGYWWALGLSDRIDYSSPMQVGTLTNWKAVTSGRLTVIAIKTDNTLWTWGSGGNGPTGVGQLGDGTTVAKSSPIQIGTLTNWSKVASKGLFVTAIKTDGTLWAWGQNSYGYLGDNTTTDRLSPVQIGALTNWLMTSSSYRFTLATKTNGTIWTWGLNHQGQLGDGTTTNRSSPAQLGVLTNWTPIKLSASQNGANLIKADGTLWGWGQAGKYGIGVESLSPVQVGTLTSWLDIAAGWYHTTAISS